MDLILMSRQLSRESQISILQRLIDIFEGIVNRDLRLMIGGF